MTTEDRESGEHLRLVVAPEVSPEELANQPGKIEAELLDELEQSPHVERVDRGEFEFGGETRHMYYDWSGMPITAEQFCDWYPGRAKVKSTRTKGFEVQTDFVGIDHRPPNSDDAPWIFETRATCGPVSFTAWSSDEELARKQHKRMTRLCRMAALMGVGGDKWAW